MHYCYSVALHPCGSCVSHSHCKDCCNRVQEDLLTKPWIRNPSLDPEKKVLTLESDLSPDDLEELLEDTGVFVL